MSRSAAPVLTAKEAVLGWITELGDFPPGLAAVYYLDGGRTAHLHDNSGNVVALYLRPFGEGIGGWEMTPYSTWPGHQRPISTYWGQNPIQHLHDTLTAKYGLAAEKD